MINIGIVGAGGMGTVHHSNYRHLDGCAVVGVVDPSPAGRERAAQWGVPCYESITDMVEAGGVDVDSITMDTSFEDLGADSLDIVEMTMAVEEEFGLEDMDEEDLSGISTVADLIRYLKSKLED